MIRTGPLAAAEEEIRAQRYALLRSARAVQTLIQELLELDPVKRAPTALLYLRTRTLLERAELYDAAHTAYARVLAANNQKETSAR